MQAHLLLAMALMGPPADPACAAAGWRASPWTAGEIRDEFQQVLGRVRRESTFVLRRDVPDLVLLYGVLETSDVLPLRPRVDMRQRVEFWLEESAERLRRDRALLTKPSRTLRRGDGRATSRKMVGQDHPSLAGGTEASNVRELIDLIESTIHPESWDVNGGAGTVRYFSPLHVLVIRNTQPVHEEIGGVLDALGAQR